ncbi:MAG TPA: SRPBCC family protein [Methylomirabilota bacterium]|nr:SRPBCC family protein [Methylomirabilota bacterium]
MKTRMTWLTALGLGAGTMYLFDPQGGNRRRALIRDKLVRTAHKAADAAEVTARDLRNRALGVAASTRSRFAGGPVDDRVLAERVRAQLGRACSHPRSIVAWVQDGSVTLNGPILAAEVDRVLSRVRAVPGVRNVEHRFDVHERGDDVPGLQGGAPRHVRSGLMQTCWSPTSRLAAGAAGITLAAIAARSGGVVGAATGAAGLALLARGATNLEFRRLLGIGTGRRAIDIRKTVNIDAPVEVVYEFWTDLASFPQFMSNVRKVQDLDDGRSRWTVAGPAGVPVEWEAVITDLVPNQVLAWETAPGSTVEHAGRVQFRTNRFGGTRVDIQMSYAPPAGALGHAVAALFGADAKSELDADLARMKTLIETGRLPRDAAQSSSREASG